MLFRSELAKGGNNEKRNFYKESSQNFLCRIPSLYQASLKIAHKLIEADQVFIKQEVEKLYEQIEQIEKSINDLENIYYNEKIPLNDEQFAGMG